jgi:hypothetical protein
LKGKAQQAPALLLLHDVDHLASEGDPEQVPAQAQTNTAVGLDAGCGGLDGQADRSVHLPAHQAFRGAAECRLPMADDPVDPQMVVPVGQRPSGGAVGAVLRIRDHPDAVGA